MSDCCSSNKTQNLKENCPLCHSPSSMVAFTTVQQHIKSPWSRTVSDEQYYFCAHNVCEAVYFNLEKVIYKINDVRLELGIKSDNKNSLICYCFGVSKTQSKDPSIKEYVISRTKAKECDCSNRNPSGKCCLKDFPI